VLEYLTYFCSMSQQAGRIINPVKDALRVVEFYKEDSDHVLFCQFRRLHFHNLLKKHAELKRLDERVYNVEIAMKEQPDGTDHPEALKRAKEYEGLLEEIDKALKDFGLYSHSMLYHAQVKPE
jgi:uncharacterized protein YpiB (UPF0302 family)